MRQTILYLFLFTYTTVMFRPVMPFVKDTVAHLLFYKDHMLTAHAHNGKFHVHKEVAEAAKNDQSEKNTNNIKKEKPGNEHIVLEIVSTQKFLKPTTLYFPFLSTAPLVAFVHRHFPPPRV